MNPVDIELFLYEVDNSFPIPLSQKQDLKEFAKKLCEKATLCIEYEEDKIVALVAGYTEDVIENRAYISIVATAEAVRGKGYASRLIKKFIEISREKGLKAVHLYAVPDNFPAVNMYKKLGFKEWIVPNEPRVKDLHLIYHLDI